MTMKVDRKAGGEGWIRTTEARASDLQSDPFGHSGTSPGAPMVERMPTVVKCLDGANVGEIALLAQARFTDKPSFCYSERA